MNKQAYEFLNSVRVLHWQWLRLKAKHDELESCLQPKAIRYDRVKVQNSHGEDQIGKIISQVNELERKMDVIQINKSKRINEIDEAIKALESEEQRTALTMRFINRTPVSQIADAMGYAEPTIYKFLNAGAEHIVKNNAINNINA